MSQEVRGVGSFVWHAFNGDAKVIGRLDSFGPRALHAAASALGPLVVTTSAVSRVIADYQSGMLTDDEVMRWAWFIRRGYVPFSGDMEPVHPLEIVYASEAEDLIVEVIGRLTEIWDAIDGVISPEELAEFTRLLTEQSGEGP